VHPRRGTERGELGAQRGQLFEAAGGEVGLQSGVVLRIRLEAVELASMTVNSARAGRRVPFAANRGVRNRAPACGSARTARRIR
jgi:hypothetical protein